METGFKYASLLSKIVLILVIIAFLLHMIGFNTVYWTVRKYREKTVYPGYISAVDYKGLWKSCTSTRFMTLCKGFTSSGSWF